MLQGTSLLHPQKRRILRMNTVPSPTPTHPHLPPSQNSSLTSLETNEADLLLIQQIAAQNVRALEQLYDRYSGQLYALIVRIVKDGNAAEGLVQETFLQLWQKSSEYSATGVPAAWIFRIARNKALDHLRRNKVRPISAEKELESHYDLAVSDTDDALSVVEATVEQEHERHHLRTALAEIPAEQRTCLELAYFEGMSQREIAAFTNTPIGTIKTRIKIGMQKMQRLLRSYGYKSATGAP